jgi:hypothetical protein
MAATRYRDTVADSDFLAHGDTYRHRDSCIADADGGAHTASGG